MRPLKITATMRDPICSYGGEIMLDAVLEHVAWRRAGRKTYLMGDPPDSYEIPLKRSGDRESWVWHCSSVSADWVFDDLSHKTRQFPFAKGRYLDPKQRKINVGAGPTKSFRLPLPLMFAPELTWHCFGHRGLIEGMLDEIQWLGKEHNRGRGKILRWSVEDLDEDRSLVYDGQPMRPLPVCLFPELIGCRTGQVGHRPPYWHPERRTLCYLPSEVS